MRTASRGGSPRLPGGRADKIQVSLKEKFSTDREIRVNERQSCRLQNEGLQRQRNIRENLCRSVERKQENL
jgi:hypothetical protein